MSDAVVYRDSAAEITPTLARIMNVSYPINGIASVYVTPPSKSGLHLWTVLCTLAGVAMIAGGAFGGVIFLVIAGALFLRAKGLESHLVLRTASGETRAMGSQDIKRLFAIKAAIEKAVTIRG